MDSTGAQFIAQTPDAGSLGEGYQALINLALENLQIGYGTIIDSVSPYHLTRAMCWDLFQQTQAQLVQFELHTKNQGLHKSRVEQHKPDVLTSQVPTWQEVKDREYEVWNERKDGPVKLIWTDDLPEAFCICLRTIRSVTAPKDAREK